MALDALLSDSIESGPQTFTDDLRERFIRLRGYDPLPWLPAIAGYVVGDAARADRFLWDHRRTLADLLAREYYGTVADVARARGLTYYAEALEDHRPQLGDDLAMRSHADVPMGAMWVFDERPSATYVADLKGASSVAHVYGKAFTGAESMTAFHRPWSYTPRRLKHVADLQLALGVTRFCIHTSPHQPVGVPPPGIALSPYLGQAFVRTEPWAELAGPWIDYLARCSWLLNQGAPAVDVAVFVGEEAPVTVLPFPDLPGGLDFDYVNLDGLEQEFTVDGGALTAGTARYRLLYLGGSSARLTVRALRRLTELVAAGATVVGPRPAGSPSLADDDREHARLCDALWGRGQVREEVPTGSASLTVEGADLLRIGRRTAAGEVVFLANPAPAPATVTVATTWPVAPVAWDPVTLRRTALVDGRLTLAPFGSVFLVPGGPVDPPWRAPAAEIPCVGAWRLSLSDTVLPAARGRGPSSATPRPSPARTRPRSTWTASCCAAVRRCSRSPTSGTSPGSVVNGVDCGVAWTHPFRVDVSAGLRPGRNTVEIAVATAWMNRLIAEAAARPAISSRRPRPSTPRPPRSGRPGSAAR